MIGPAPARPGATHSPLRRVERRVQRSPLGPGRPRMEVQVAILGSPAPPGPARHTNDTPQPGFNDPVPRGRPARHSTPGPSEAAAPGPPCHSDTGSGATHSPLRRVLRSSPGRPRTKIQVTISGSSTPSGPARLPVQVTHLSQGSTARPPGPARAMTKVPDSEHPLTWVCLDIICHCVASDSSCLTNGTHLVFSSPGGVSPAAASESQRFETIW